MNTVKFVFGLTALASISACGLKGDLERPKPIFREAPTPVMAPAEPPVAEKEVIEQDVPDDELLGGPEG